MINTFIIKEIFISKIRSYGFYYPEDVKQKMPLTMIHFRHLFLKHLSHEQCALVYFEAVHQEPVEFDGVVTG